MKYVDASAILRVILGESGPVVALTPGDTVVSSELLEVEVFRAVDRERLLGHLDDSETARQRKELADVVGRLDLVQIDRPVIERARSSFAVNVRALDAIHAATAELLVAETGEELEFRTHDKRQGIAAASRGLVVCGL
jgi:predicted nucleic acid-binding protein